ncbi:MAG: hypothetical protein ACRCTQ_01085 [Brevinemataceae bacterium]
MELFGNNFFIVLMLIFMSAFAVFLISGKLAFYADQLSVSAGISGALIGFILIALITSVPEIISTFVSAGQGMFGLTAGGIWGSNIINLALLSIILLIFHSFNFKLDQNSIITFAFSLIMLLITGILLFVHYYWNIILNKYIVITIVNILYLLMMYYLYRIHQHTSQSQSQSSDQTNLKTIAVMFIIFALLIIAVSWILVILCDKIAEIPAPFYGKPLGHHFIGTIFLAAATSVPEFAMCYQLIKEGSPNMAIENISGSNVLNLVVLVNSALFAKNDMWSQIPINSFYTIGAIALATILIMLSKTTAKKVYSVGVYVSIVVIWLYSLWLIF